MNIPGSKPEVKHHDFLTLKAHCTCSECERISQPINPQISLDQELIKLREGRSSKRECDFIFFVNSLRKSGKNLPKFRFLDTIVMADAPYSLHFEEGKLRVTDRVNVKSWILQRKQYRDLKYQIEKYERQFNFTFTSFQHKCEKKIKEFQNNIKYKIPAILNRTAIVKLKSKERKEEGQRQSLHCDYPSLANLTLEDEVILSKNQFQNLFDLTKNRAFDLEQIEYLQVFPVMSGEEESSYLKIIKYQREQECTKKSFKLAEMYVGTWLQKNDSLQKLEEGVYEEISKANNGSKVTEEEKLFYQTYKLFIYFEVVTSIRVKQAIVYYITNDRGQSFFFKSLDCLKTEKRATVEEIGVELPVKKDIAAQNYISLPSEMRRMFDNFQKQFRRLDKEREEMQAKLERDKEYSNMVFRTVSDRGEESLHKVLGSSNLKYKKEKLNL